METSAPDVSCRRCGRPVPDLDTNAIVGWVIRDDVSAPCSVIVEMADAGPAEPSTRLD